LEFLIEVQHEARQAPVGNSGILIPARVRMRKPSTITIRLKSLTP